jgi:uncharacterized protein YihD (DUF1040 family)
MMGMSIPKVIMVCVSEIIAAPFNPPDRTEEEKLAELEASIKQYGILDPLKVSRDMRLIDGHRRLTCAKHLKMIEVPCIVLALGLQEGWTELNKTAMPLNSKQYVYAVGSGLDEAYLTSPMRRKMRTLQNVLGEDFIPLSQQGISLTVLDMARKVAKYLGYESPYPDSVMKEIIVWMVKHKMQTPVRNAIKFGIKKSTLQSAIKNDNPLAWGEA